MGSMGQHKRLSSRFLPHLFCTHNQLDKWVHCNMWKAFLGNRLKSSLNRKATNVTSIGKTRETRRSKGWIQCPNKWDTKNFHCNISPGYNSHKHHSMRLRHPLLGKM
uniref:Uncharacterized protein n=1 Tax=Eutreptiella gymnastica TaxID=73025 RepID=A0A7S1J9C0_9EUGL|mmetsp:Transcript_7772/g.13816  ORF Transcript_7772/g.13816 Transcript_7772/m.13816 type:complete len:107 (+) Transcript_7772:115-435(+)